MHLRDIIHIPRRTAKILIFSVVAASVLFIALTRTKVGRDGLRAQLESQFNNTFIGNVEIERLQGNLLNTLYAHNIHFIDSSGLQVASIDAAILEPSWFDLLRRTISMNRITLIKPRLSAVQREDSSWNIQDLFRRKDGLPPQFLFNSSDIRIIDGTLRASVRQDTSGLPVDSLSQFSSIELHHVQSRMNVELRSKVRLLDVEQASFEIPEENISINEMYGQVLLAQDRIELNEFFVESPTSHLSVSAAIVPPINSSNIWDTFLELDIRDSILDLDMVRSFFPQVAIADTVFLSASIQGSLKDLNIESFQLAHGNLILDGFGAVSGLPDSLALSAELNNSTYSKKDLLSIAPNLPLAPLAGRYPLSVHALSVKGSLPMENGAITSPTYGEVDFDISSRGGSIQGGIELSRNPADSIFQLHSRIETDSLDLASLLADVRVPSSLTGILTVEGTGKSLNTLTSDIQVNLGPSSIATHPIDTMDTYLFLEEETVYLVGQAGHFSYGQLRADASLLLNEKDQPLSATVQLVDLNLGRFVQDDSLNTALNGLVHLQTTGYTLPTLRGQIDLDIDSSTISQGSFSRDLPPHSATLSLLDIGENAQLFSLRGDVARASVVGPLDPAMVYSLGKLWSTSLKTTFTEIINKTPPASSSPDEEDQFLTHDPSQPTYTFADSLLEKTLSDLYLEQLSANALDVLQKTSSTSPHNLSIDFEIIRSDLITPWFKSQPTISTNLAGQIDIRSDPNEFFMEGSVRADSLSMSHFKLDQLKGEFSLGSERDKVTAEQIAFEANFQADSLYFIGQTFPLPTFIMEVDDRRGTLSLLTKSTRRVGPQRLQSTFELLPEKNRFYIDDLFLSVGNSFWTVDTTTYLDVYGQTVVIPGLPLQSKSIEANILQRIHLSGVLSPITQDTAFISIDNIALRPISQFLNMEVPLGGLLNGQLLFTTTRKQPELTGSIHVDRFTFDDRVLGDITISSRYLQGEPDVGLRVALTPIDPFDRDQFLPDAVIPATYEENEITLEGTFRLPRFNQSATGFLDAGALDLDLDILRADVFFFEYIFKNLLERTDGFLSGQGSIAGDFTYPLFDLNLRIDEGDLYIPKFNLNYTEFNGPLHIDEEGIKLQNMTFKDPTGGQATVYGGILFNEYRFFSFDLEAKLDEILIMNQDLPGDLPFYGQIWGSGTLKLTGPTDDAFLFSQDAFTKASSELFIPVTEDDFTYDEGFIIFADSAGNIPDFRELAYRKNLLSKRPEGERKFIDGLAMDLNISVPSGSTIHLVFDPLLGDVINAVSSGRVQLQRREGEFTTFGTLSVESGDYLFTAGDVFARRFLFDGGGTISWDGSPIDARLNIPASYRTRASTAGLPGTPFDENTQIPLIVRLDITGRVSSPMVELSLETDRSDRSFSDYQSIDSYLNQSQERTTDLATSVLLTNSFLLTTESGPNTGQLTNSGEQIAFSSVSQLVSSQLNRFLNEAIPNVDFNLGLQGESLDETDVTYGVALYLLNERLIIRGQGIYQNDLAADQAGLEGEFEVEVRLSSNVSVSVFLRREGDLLAENALTRARGAGLSYQTQFSSWRRFFDRLFGWMNRKKDTYTDESVAEDSRQEQ